MGELRQEGIELPLLQSVLEISCGQSAVAVHCSLQASRGARHWGRWGILPSGLNLPALLQPYL